MSPTVAIAGLMKALFGKESDDDDEPEVTDYQRMLGEQIHRKQNKGR